jgi:hypothetical protein
MADIIILHRLRAPRGLSRCKGIAYKRAFKRENIQVEGEDKVTILPT